MRDILAEFWARKEVVTRKNGYRGPQFRVTCRTTQGGLTSPTLFNVAVDRMVRHWLSTKVEDNAVINDSLGHVVGRSLGVFYTNDDILGSQDQECIQVEINVSIGMFHRIGLLAKADKSKTMTCQPGEIR